MAELTSRERLQPSLLDRLTDLDPDTRHEARERRVLSPAAFRNCVRRDIGWILNATGLEAVQDLDAYPYVAASVVNFGFGDLAGRHCTGATIAMLERRIRDTLRIFEPRLVPETIRVKALDEAGQTDHHHVIRFEIEADLWSQPYPERLYLRTELDLEGGEVRITDAAAGGALPNAASGEASSPSSTSSTSSASTALSAWAESSESSFSGEVAK